MERRFPADVADPWRPDPGSAVDLDELAERQHAAFTREQARAVGLTDRRLDGMLDRRTLRRAAPGVFVVNGCAIELGAAPPDRHPRAARLAGVSSSGDVAPRLDGIDHAPLEVLVVRGQHRRRRPSGIVIHETKDLRGPDLYDGIPCTSLVRTLVDLPAVVHELRAGVALDHAMRSHAGVLDRVAARHAEVARRGRNGTVALRALLAERGAGDIVDSGFERKALRLIKASDLPRPATQHHVVDGDFQCWLDLAWPDHLVAMECDSLAHHQGERAFRWERVRRRHLNRLGWTVLEFTYREVTQQGLMVLNELARHLPSRFCQS